MRHSRRPYGRHRTHDIRLLDENSAFSFEIPALPRVCRARKRLRDKEWRAGSPAPGVALRGGTQRTPVVISASELAMAILSKFPALHERILDMKYFNRPLPNDKHQTDGDDAETIFRNIMRFNRWNDAESVSGVGSNSRYTNNIRSKLPSLLRKYNILSILDAPCGDFVWMRKVAIDSRITYIGGDIVHELVERLQGEFASRQRRFIHLDIVSSELPDADILICRDCFIHLSNAQVLAALRNFTRSDIKSILTTTYNFGRVNTDVSTGQFRAINLRAAPFSLPPPIETIVDYIYPFPPRRLALWSRDQLVAWQAERDDPDKDKASRRSTM